MDVPLLKDLIWKGQTYELTYDLLESLDGDLVRLPSSRAMLLFQDVRRTGRVTKLWVFVRDRRIAAYVTLIHEHWRPVGLGMLQHVLDDTVHLRWIPMALSGGVVELSMGEEEFGWPWWVQRDVKVVDDPVHHLNSRKRPLVTLPPVRPTLPTVHETVTMPKAQRTILDKWERSSRACDTRGCRLLGSRVVADEGRTLGDVVAIRRTTHELESRILPVLLEVFGADYSRLSVAHASKDERICAYEVQDATTSETVAVVMLVLFDTVVRGHPSVAVLIDSLAVRPSMQARGIGGRIFHDLCRALAEEQCPSASSYMLFAQCLRKAPASTFWKEKLDSSSEGRDVMLQAFRLGHVAVQTETQCEVRARTYWRENSSRI